MLGYANFSLLTKQSMTFDSFSWYAWESCSYFTCTFSVEHDKITWFDVAILSRFKLYTMPWEEMTGWNTFCRSSSFLNAILYRMPICPYACSFIPRNCFWLAVLWLDVYCASLKPSIMRIYSFLLICPE